MACNCPSMDKIPADKRVIWYEPVMPPVAHIWHKDCPVHGYKRIEEESGESLDTTLNDGTTTDL